MKLALDYKKLHLRFLLGTGIAVVAIKRVIKNHAGDDASDIKVPGRQIKRLLKDYKRKNGPLTLLEIESNGTKIKLKL